MFKNVDELCGFIATNAGMANVKELSMLREVLGSMDTVQRERYFTVAFPRMLQLVEPLLFSESSSPGTSSSSSSVIIFQQLAEYYEQSCAGDGVCILTLQRSVVASLLAASFFGYFHAGNGGKSYFGKRSIQARQLADLCPGMDFVELYTRPRSLAVMKEKLKCLLSYFDLFISNDNMNRISDGHISFQRKQVSKFPDFFSLDSAKCVVSSQCRLDIASDNQKIEDAPGNYEKVDFANCVVGGGVLGNGCVQEEILFLIYPELLVSRLFTSPLRSNECLIIKGARRFSNYTGYSSSFRFAGPCGDVALMEESVFIAVDALYFKNRGSQCDLLCQQVEKPILIRELNKLYVGYTQGPLQTPDTGNCRRIVSGNWGCGAFNGNVQLKFLLQLIVMSALCEPIEMRYCTLSHPDLLLAREVVHLLDAKRISIQSLLQTISVDYKEHLWDMCVEQEDEIVDDSESLDLFRFIYETYS